MVPVFITPPLVFNLAYCEGVGVENCCAALMVIFPFPGELMKALGVGASLVGEKPEDVTPLRLLIILPNMYHIRGLLPLLVWVLAGDDAASLGAAARVLTVEEGSPVLAEDQSAAFSNFVVSTVSQEKFSS